MVDAPVKVGDVLAGKFRVERVLGVGGMGVVVAATHLHLDQMVALKFMLSQVASSPEFVSRFLREARAAAKLKNQHCAKVLDVGTLDDGAPYIVLEFLEGRDLHQLLEERGKLSTEVAVDYVMQACVGMSEAHNKGIIHRDLKPQNLFLSTGADGLPIVKILDFGIAKASFDVDGAKTQSQAVMGSPYYMAPEQMRSAKQADARSDIWALGAILYHLLSGRLPFRGDSLPVLCVEIMTNPPSDFDASALQVPQGLKDIVFRCLDKDPAKRPQTVTEFVRLLAPYSPTHGAARLTKASALSRAGTDPGTDPGDSGALPASGSAQGMPAHRLAPTQIADAKASPPKSTTMGASAGEIHRGPAGAPSGSGRPAYLVPAIGALVLAAAGIGVFVSMGGESESKQAARVEEAPQPVQETAPAVEFDARAVTTQTFRVETRPSGVEVSIDGELLGPSPLSVEREVGDEMQLRLALTGYEAQESLLKVAPGQELYSFELQRSRRKRADSRTKAKDSRTTSTEKVSAKTAAKPVEKTVQKPVEPAKAKAPRDRLERRLRNLKNLYNEGLLSEQEYKQKRRVILNEEM